MFEGLAGLLLLAVALSVDGFGAGLGFGLRRTRVDGRSLALIGLIAGVMVLVTSAAGHLLGRQVGALARQLGAALLLVLGVVSLVNGWRERKAGTKATVGAGAQRDVRPGDGASGSPPPAGRNTLWSLQLRTWGLVVEVARQPGRADLDQSGSISLPEALILGLALSLDSGAVGFGAGLAGFSPWAVAAAVAPVNVALLWLGTRAGRRLVRERRQGWLVFSPGFILLVLALMRLLP